MQEYYKRQRGDRYDGYRIRKLDGVLTLMPYLQRTRLDSQCFFEDVLEIGNLEKFVEQKKAEIPGLSIMHVIIAGIVRAISQWPYLNRFLVHHKLYAHKTIQLSMMVKRSLDPHEPETAIRPVFDPFDTLYEVAAKINKEVEACRTSGENNETDAAVELLGHLPDWLIKLVAWYIRYSDNRRFMPKFLYEASPYHASAFVANLGSLGIDSVFHHLYEFGTCSFFLTIGKKHRQTKLDKNGKPVTVKTMNLRYVVDERVCEGHYNALAIRFINKLLNNPELLLSPPEKVVLDDGITNKMLIDPNEARVKAAE